MTLPKIADKDRRTEDELWATYRDAQPKLVGALLDAAVGALRDLPDTQLPQLPRMADFARWLAAAERALGWPPARVSRRTRGIARERTLP